MCLEAGCQSGQAALLQCTGRLLLARGKPAQALQAAEEALRLRRAAGACAGEEAAAMRLVARASLAQDARASRLACGMAASDCDIDSVLDQCQARSGGCGTLIT
ncbi:unnamed protein product [Prorocentrum cordatum]|uniref:Anaphase-promoting complex subunit 5 n=1 Tax=Prorocentrum cordatum TaxID=2364126 RepID=A0ABN9TGW7_9DINO|nr:unnamed protein product [Polarella glacialis]